MQFVPTSVSELLDAFAPLSLHIYLDGKSVSTHIVSATYAPACSGSDGFSIGNACSARFDLVVSDTDISFYGRNMTVKWSVDSSDEYFLFTGTVDDVRTTSGQTTVTAYDALYTSGTLSYAPSSGVLSACNGGDVLSDIAKRMGVSAASEALTLAKTVSLTAGVDNIGKNISCSDAAACIAMLVGGNAIMTRDGKLSIRQYSAVNYSAVGYADGETADAVNYSVTGLTLTRTDTVSSTDEYGSVVENEKKTDYKAGDGSLGFENNLATQALTDSVFSVLKGVSVRGGSFSIPGGITLEPGDLIAIKVANTSYTVACASLTIDYDGGVKTTITSYGAPSAEGATGPLTQAVNAVAADVANVKSIVAENVKAATAQFERVDATVADIESLKVDKASVTALSAAQAEIKQLEADKLSAADAALKYANIDFSNIGKAAIEQFYATSGIIKDLVIGDTTITGELVGVTIRGNLIEGGTVVADKLVVKGEDGLYYKLNTDGVTTEAQQTDYNSLSGQIIRAKSITASKIAVDDLVAFGATIGGFHITDSALYSGVKDSPTNTTRGVYLDSSGQLSVGDSKSYLRYYKDSSGQYRLEIAASSMNLSTGQSVEESLEAVNQKVEQMRDEISSILRIDSSRGTVFKNNQVSTVLTVTVFHGSQVITDINGLRAAYGDGAYLQWKWQRLDEESFGLMSAADKRFSNDGFSFTLSPDDVDTKITFRCEIIVE